MQYQIAFLKLKTAAVFIFLVKAILTSYVHFAVIVLSSFDVQERRDTLKYKIFEALLPLYIILLERKGLRRELLRQCFEKKDVYNIMI